MNRNLLLVAGLFEVGFAACLCMAKLATGMSTMLWVIGFLSTLAISIYLLNKAVKDISFAAGFATWAGFGALGSLMVGSVLFVNPIDVVRLLFIYALIASITGLRRVAKTMF